MDVARFLVRERCMMVRHESFSVKINNDIFRIKMMEDSHGPMRIALKYQEEGKVQSKISLESSSEWGMNDLEKMMSEDRIENSNSWKEGSRDDKAIMVFEGGTEQAWEIWTKWLKWFKNIKSLCLNQQKSWRRQQKSK